MLCWLHAQSWDIPLQRPASVCVIVSKLSANCRATTRSPKAREAPGPAWCSGLWPQLRQFFVDGAAFQNRAGVLLCKPLPRLQHGLRGSKYQQVSSEHQRDTHTSPPAAGHSAGLICTCSGRAVPDAGGTMLAGDEVQKLQCSGAGVPLTLEGPLELQRQAGHMQAVCMLSWGAPEEGTLFSVLL